MSLTKRKHLNTREETARLLCPEVRSLLVMCSCTPTSPSGKTPNKALLLSALRTNPLPSSCQSALQTLLNVAPVVLRLCCSLMPPAVYTCSIRCFFKLSLGRWAGNVNAVSRPQCNNWSIDYHSKASVRFELVIHEGKKI